MTSLCSPGGLRLPVVLFLVAGLFSCASPAGTKPAAVVAATAITVDHAALRVALGAEETLTAAVSPANATDQTVTWASSNPAVATVSASGVLSALQTGTSELTATHGAFTSVTTITVTTPEVFITGNHTDDGVVAYGGYWVDGVWNALAYDSATYAGGSTVKQAAFDGVDVYIAGTLFDASYNKTGGYWKNGVWTAVSGEGSEAVAVAGGHVYVAGYSVFWSRPAYWVDGVRHDLVFNTTKFNESVYVTGLVVAGNDVTVVGSLWGDDDIRPVTWVNGVLTFLPLPAGLVYGDTGQPTRSGHDLYIPGRLWNLADGNQIGVWKNGVWTGTSSTTSNDSVAAVGVRAGQIHLVANESSSANSANAVPADWINGTKSLLTFGQSVNTGYTTGVALVGIDVLVSGYYSVNYRDAGTPGFWTNGTWTALSNAPGNDVATYGIWVR